MQAVGQVYVLEEEENRVGAFRARCLGVERSKNLLGQMSHRGLAPVVVANRCQFLGTFGPGYGTIRFMNSNAVAQDPSVALALNSSFLHALYPSILLILEPACFLWEFPIHSVQWQLSQEPLADRGCRSLGETDSSFGRAPW